MIINREPIQQFSEEHHYTPEKSGRIDSTTWAVYTTDPNTGEKLLVGWQVCRPRDLIAFVKERLEKLEKRYKWNYEVGRIITISPECLEKECSIDKQTIEAIKYRLSEIEDEQEDSIRTVFKDLSDELKEFIKSTSFFTVDEYGIVEADNHERVTVDQIEEQKTYYETGEL